VFLFSVSHILMLIHRNKTKIMRKTERERESSNWFFLFRCISMSICETEKRTPVSTLFRCFSMSICETEKRREKKIMRKRERERERDFCAGMNQRDRERQRGEKE